MRKTPYLFLLATSICAAAERATFDSAGRLTALIHQGHTLPVLGQLVLVLEDGREVALQPHDQRSPIRRPGPALHWTGSPLDALAAGVEFDVAWTQTEDGRLELTGKITTARSRRVRAVEYVVALPREAFVDGQLGAAPTRFPRLKPDDPTFWRENAASVASTDAHERTRVDLTFDRTRPIRAVDTWTTSGRWYELRTTLATGAWRADEPIEFQLTLARSGTVEAGSGVVTVRPDERRQQFLGFGANYCWVNTSPVVDYTLEHLKSTWVRFELKLGPWIAERENPGPELRRDFELMRRVQQAGIPWIISLWRLSEDYYVPREPGASAMGHGRRIAPERWNDFLTQLGEFLVYVKQHYDAEPEMFSFNEPDLGVDIVFSAEEHRDAIKRIGRHLQQLGLKTKLLLGDTANPRDRHLYVLPTAADPEAMRYVAGVSFHSWGGATPEQYAAWGDVAEWIQRPLFVGEAGMDPGAYRNRTYDSYTYGLREMKDHFDFVRHGRAQVSLYWQFTNDYSLVRVTDGGAIEPTGRFHLMRHLNNLTPANAHVVAAETDQPDLHVLAFAVAEGLVVHLLNPGPACRLTLNGLATNGDWTVTTTTETQPFATSVWSGGGFEMPARSIVTLTSGRR